MHQREIKRGIYRLAKTSGNLEAQRASGRYVEVLTPCEGANAVMVINWGSNYLVQTTAAALESIPAEEATRVQEVFAHLAEFPELTRCGERIQAALEKMEIYVQGLVGTHLYPSDYKDVDDLLAAAAQDAKAMGYTLKPEICEGLRAAWADATRLLAELDQLETEFIRKAVGQAA